MPKRSQTTAHCGLGTVALREATYVIRLLGSRLESFRARTLCNLAAATVADLADETHRPDEQVLLSDVADFLSGLPLLHRAGLLLLVGALEVLPLVRGYRHQFSKLSRPEQRAFLNSMETSRFYPFRGGCLAIKCILIVNYFARPEPERALGYRHSCLKEPYTGADQ